MKVEGKNINFDKCYMWVSFNNGGTTKKGMVQDGEVMKISDVFMGYRLPVRLVKNK
jgi:hypothetical protein